jgi:xanthine dehydrogenase small subunit
MQQTVRFVLDEKIVEIDFSKSTGLKPTTTVLNYLRSLPGHKGVKEGCAEGDCGACTIVIAEPGENSKLFYRALDSCLLFLPVIHGKQLITVENLTVEDQQEKVLHPVQQMMVETNGSQCGYCTPGIVMSLFGLYKNHQEPTRDAIGDALSGNLCRCTGYRPIIEAAEKACIHHGQDHFTSGESNIIALLNTINNNKETLEIITPGQKYLKPFTLREALRLRLAHPSAIIINGSTDVALRQTRGREFLPEILDISAVEEMKHFIENEEDCFFGAGLSLESMKKIARERFPALHDILKVFGSLQIRNIGTIGGNIGSASPVGDLLPVLFAYKARVKLQSAASERMINIEDFITGYRKTVIKADELITGIIIPVRSPGVKVWSYKVSKRKDMDISTVCGAFRLEKQDGKVKEIMIAFGGMAEMTKRAPKTEAFLTGKSWTRGQIEEAMEILGGEFMPISDARSEAEFRKLAARNLLMKFFLENRG